MAPSRPFITPSGKLDTDQLLKEAIPLAKLIGGIGVVVLIPVLLQILLLDFLAFVPVLGGLFTLVTQFLLAVGSGLVLLYVFIRANQLAHD